jgi:hypothetical protein
MRFHRPDVIAAFVIGADLKATIAKLAIDLVDVRFDARQLRRVLRMQPPNGVDQLLRGARSPAQRIVDGLLHLGQPDDWPHAERIIAPYGV